MGWFKKNKKIHSVKHISFFSELNLTFIKKKKKKRKNPTKLKGSLMAEDHQSFFTISCNGKL
jgi:hypothetical protein